MLRQLSRQVQALSGRAAGLQRGLAAQAATQVSSSGGKANPFYNVPEGHVNSDLSNTACNIGLTR